MLIRPETPADYAAVYAFIQKAFETAKVSNGEEQNFVNKLRAGGNYLPGLALVAEAAGEIAAHVMLTRLPVTGARPVKGLLLAPLAVRLDLRGRGLGAQITREALARARAQGYEAVFLVGDPAYYGRFGFARLDSFGGECNREIPAMYALALELNPGVLAGARVKINFLG